MIITHANIVHQQSDCEVLRNISLENNAHKNISHLCFCLNPTLNICLISKVNVNDLGLHIVLLLDLPGTGLQLAQSSADQHNVLSSLGQLLTQPLAWEDENYSTFSA